MAQTSPNQLQLLGYRFLYQPGEGVFVYRDGTSNAPGLERLRKETKESIEAAGFPVETIQSVGPYSGLPGFGAEGDVDSLAKVDSLTSKYIKELKTATARTTEDGTQVGIGNDNFPREVAEAIVGDTPFSEQALAQQYAAGAAQASALDAQRQTPARFGIASQSAGQGVATPTPVQIPFKAGLTDAQKQSIQSLVASGRPFNETDAKNYAFAIGDANWQKYVGQTGRAVTVQQPAPTTGGFAFTPQQFQGLSAADARRRAGTANETDLQNLAYAESKGWTQGTPTTGAPGPGTQPTPASPGDLLTGDYKVIYDQSAALLDELKKRGQTINTDVEITPASVAEFMKNVETNLSLFTPFAEKEILPFYQNQLQLARQSLLQSAGYSTEDILRNEQELERQYGKGVEAIGETAAETGFALSGRRQAQEQELAATTGRQIETGRRELGRAATEAAQGFAQQFGTANLPAAPSLGFTPVPVPGQPGFTRSSTAAPLYQLSDDVYSRLKGTQQFQQEASIQSRAAELEEAYRRNEALKQQQALVQ